MTIEPTRIQLVETVLMAIANWAKNHPDILALAIVGSWARGTATGASDVDLMLLTEEPGWFKTNTSWIEQINWQSSNNIVINWRDAQYGVIWSRHVYLTTALEIEFSFGFPSWAAVNPIDPQTAKVIQDGCIVLYDPHLYLTNLQRQLTKANQLN